MRTTTVNIFRKRTVAVNHSRNRTVGKETMQKDRQKAYEGNIEIKDLCQTLSKAFNMSMATAKVSPKFLKEDDQDSVRKAKRSPVERSWWKPYW